MSVAIKLIYKNPKPGQKPLEGEHFDLFYTGQTGTQPDLLSMPHMQAWLDGDIASLVTDESGAPVYQKHPHRYLFGTIGNSGYNEVSDHPLRQRSAMVDMEDILRIEDNA